jgi:hypothetical protein
MPPRVACPTSRKCGVEIQWQSRVQTAGCCGSLSPRAPWVVPQRVVLQERAGLICRLKEPYSCVAWLRIRDAEGSTGSTSTRCSTHIPHHRNRAHWRGVVESNRLSHEARGGCGIGTPQLRSPAGRCLFSPVSFLTRRSCKRASRFFLPVSSLGLSQPGYQCPRPGSR